MHLLNNVSLKIIGQIVRSPPKNNYKIYNHLQPVDEADFHHDGCNYESGHIFYYEKYTPFLEVYYYGTDI